jgi:hypothetical protein
MKYTHPDYNIIINASGGYRVLDRLGFQSAHELENNLKREERKEKFKQFIESQPFIDKICSFCQKPFKTKNPRTRTDSITCGQQLRRKEGR